VAHGPASLCKLLYVMVCASQVMGNGKGSICKGDLSNDCELVMVCASQTMVAKKKAALPGNAAFAVGEIYFVLL